MNSTKNRIVATTMVGLSVFGSLMLTSAFAAPPKGKKPPAKSDKKKDTKKKDDPAVAIAAGKKVYEAQGCSGCHAIGDAGGKNGPELTKVGADAKHTSKWLTDAVVDPKIHNPNSSMPPYGDKVKGKDLTNLVAYLGSLKK